jgi:DNA segregation ATPase FtsK/SpoIIIE, S-DNA-T family
MARKKKKPVRRTISLSKTHIAIILLVVSLLYFFALFFAKWSPILEIAKKIFAVVMWAQGIHVLFGLCFLAAIWLFAKDGMLRTTIKQWVLAGVLFSAFLNFPLLTASEWWLLDTTQCIKYGWYISRPVLWILQQVFGADNSWAIKIIIVVMTLALFVRVFISRNMTLPSIPKLSVTPGASTPASKTKQIAKKVKEVVEEYEDEEEYEEENTIVAKKWSVEKAWSVVSLLKSTIKDKVEKKIQEKETQKIINFPKDKPTFDISLLQAWNTSGYIVDESYLMEKATALQSKLEEFSIPVDIKWFNVWPSVVQIKISPQQWIKISSIESYQKDLTLALKTKSLRILAPIPGTDVVGIEIPNPQPQLIRLRQIMSMNGFKEAIHKNLTNLVLWMWIDGKPIRQPLEKMPHLLVAWATGSGKSIAVNTFILSLIYQNSPSELKFLMIDPKQVELGMYDGIPYLLAPVETVPDKALKILKWWVAEMEKRYGQLKEKRVKNLDEYNAKVTWEEALPRIVVIIDELADLMMNRNTKKDTELCITRIAQKARAVGIHLIVATQRPSVDVVTGLIKANIPTRIALSVVSQIDSRTILDVKWAEELLGKWDMLFMDPSNNIPIRIQWPLVTTEETDEVVMAIKAKYMDGISENDIYNQELMGILSGKNVWSGLAGGFSGGDGNDDELVQQAIEIIKQTKKASATLFQRKLWVWFARAARIMDILEDQGMIWPQDWAKPREIYI